MSHKGHRSNHTSNGPTDSLPSYLYRSDMIFNYNYAPMLDGQKGQTCYLSALILGNSSSKATVPKAIPMAARGMYGVFRTHSSKFSLCTTQPVDRRGWT